MAVLGPADTIVTTHSFDALLAGYRPSLHIPPPPLMLTSMDYDASRKSRPPDNGSESAVFTSQGHAGRELIKVLIIRRYSYCLYALAIDLHSGR